MSVDVSLGNRVRMAASEEAGSARTVACYRLEGRVAVIAIDSPPVNALGHAVRTGIVECFTRALNDPAAQAIVIACEGRTFFAGADVTELGRPIQPPLLGDIMVLFEASPKPVVAAMHGTALGGGFELALAAHYRVMAPSAAVGLPEVALGLLPGAGGTQRVPRLIGVAAAVEMIGLGRQVKAQEALALGLVDAVLREGALIEDAIAFAERLLDTKAPLRRVCDMATDLDRAGAQAVFDRFRQANPHLFIGYKAAEGVLNAIAAATELSFEAGLASEKEISKALLASPESAAQRHLFFAERAAVKLPGSEKLRAVPPSRIALIGSSGFADRLRAAGLDVVSDRDDADMVVVGAGEELPTGLTSGTIVLTDRTDQLDKEAGQGPVARRVVGLTLRRGVAEVVVGAAAGPEAALAAMALARKVGLPAIFVRPSRLGVVARLEEAAGTAGGRPASAGHAPVGPVMDAAFALLDEGVAWRASDIDFAAVQAGLWPAWQGGPAFAAQRREPAKLETTESNRS